MTCYENSAPLPTMSPTITPAPSNTPSPSLSPHIITYQPTQSPTTSYTDPPSITPTNGPSNTFIPSLLPTLSPFPTISLSPTMNISSLPSTMPTITPTIEFSSLECIDPIYIDNSTTTNITCNEDMVVSFLVSGQAAQTCSSFTLDVYSSLTNDILETINILSDGEIQHIYPSLSNRRLSQDTHSHSHSGDSHSSESHSRSDSDGSDGGSSSGGGDSSGDSRSDSDVNSDSTHVFSSHNEYYDRGSKHGRVFVETMPSSQLYNLYEEEEQDEFTSYSNKEWFQTTSNDDTNDDTNDDRNEDRNEDRDRRELTSQDTDTNPSMIIVRPFSPWDVDKLEDSFNEWAQFLSLIHI